MPTISSVLRQRRLNWFRDMLWNESHHQQYFASLFGKFSWEEFNEIEDGRPTAKAIDVVKQLFDDLNIAFSGFLFHGDWKTRIKTHKDVFVFSNTETHNLCRST